MRLLLVRLLLVRLLLVRLLLVRRRTAEVEVVRRAEDKHPPDPAARRVARAAPPARVGGRAAPAPAGRLAAGPAAGPGQESAPRCCSAAGPWPLAGQPAART